MPTSPADGRPLGVELERMRLEHRSRRIEAVLTALHERAAYYGARDGAVPRPLRQAIDDFAGEMADLRQRLESLDSPRVAAG